MSIRPGLIQMIGAAVLGSALLPLHSSGEEVTFQLGLSGDQAVPGPGACRRAGERHADD